MPAQHHLVDLLRRPPPLQALHEKRLRLRQLRAEKRGRDDKPPSPASRRCGTLWVSVCVLRFRSGGAGRFLRRILRLTHNLAVITRGGAAEEIFAEIFALWSDSPEAMRVSSRDTSDSAPLALNTSFSASNSLDSEVMAVV
eukprot:CAMPEP_0167779908 /NCGR_PEP_ID=MMETSP0111_2-20121227/5066_1 /TAXON_ID=91324 /ORGANISM="Lotharella globosa, Strain CCCM811" /LENGTH=140 /DNA_ID=CAMNT_0007670367 /DNA_START=819 /DNA_END=1241 /DNA_ORIENTATION=+